MSPKTAARRDSLLFICRGRRCAGAQVRRCPSAGRARRLARVSTWARAHCALAHVSTCALPPARTPGKHSRMPEAAAHLTGDIPTAARSLIHSIDHHASSFPRRSCVMAPTKDRLVRESDTIEISPQGGLLDLSRSRLPTQIRTDPRPVTLRVDPRPVTLRVIRVP